MDWNDVLLKDGCVGLEGNDFARSADDAEWVELRAAWTRLGDEGWNLAAKAMEMRNFHRFNRFCGVCGSEMERASDISLRCRSCGREIWPQLSPAIVVLITRHGGQEALLVHAANFRRPDAFALVAGFVETGETLEQCVAREVKEETSLDISSIRYVGSQSWPFPGQLMVGFTARHAGGELRLADGELTAGGWFSRDCPPPIPPQPSLTRRIIDAWLDSRLPSLDRSPDCGSNAVRTSQECVL